MDSNEQELARLQAAHATAPGSRRFAPLADAYRRAGRLEEAVQLLEQGTAAQPDYVSAFVLLGLCYAERGDADAAMATFERVLVQDPENLVALKHRAEHASQRQDWDQAESLLGLVLEIDPYDREASRLRETSAARRGAASSPPPRAANVTTPPAAAAPTVQRQPPQPPPQLPPVPSAPASLPEQREPAAWQVHRDEDRIVIRPRGEHPDEPIRPASPSDEFSTLTVARIYESQGYLDKALGIYETLQRRQPDDAEVCERIEALRQRLALAAIPPSTDAAAAPRWRLLDPQTLAAPPLQTAANLRDLAGAGRERKQEERHPVVEAPPSPPRPATAVPARADEPDYERFLRYVRSLKPGG